MRYAKRVCSLDNKPELFRREMKMKTTKERMFYCPDCEGEGDIVTRCVQGLGWNFVGGA